MTVPAPVAALANPRVAASSEDGRAPYKPLLVLTAIGAVTRDEPRLRPWSWWHDRMVPLFYEYGRWRNGKPIGQPLNPFGYLQSDGVWEIHQFVAGGPMATKQKGDRPSPLPKKSWLDRVDPLAGLTEPAWLAMQDPIKQGQVVMSLLSGFFDAAIWGDIVAQCGIANITSAGMGLPPRTDDQKRDPDFRDKVLEADHGVCVFCAWNAVNVQTSKPIAVEAAHVKWHQHRGPDTLANGVVACARCHRMFDRGYYGFATPGDPIVMSAAYSGPPLPERLVPERIDQTFCDWQMTTKFKG